MKYSSLSRFGCLDKAYWHPFVKNLVFGINSGIIVSSTQRYGARGLLMALIPKSLIEARMAMQRTTEDKVARRLEQGTERPDFMSFVMREDKNQELMSIAEMNANAEVLLVGTYFRSLAIMSTDALADTDKQPDRRRLQRRFLALYTSC